MRLSRKARFAVTAMLELALRQEHGPVTLTDISQRQGISLSYLEQIFARLRRQGLVEGIRGPGGGYRLGRQAGEITIADIVTTVEGPANLNPTHVAQTFSQRLWHTLSRQLQDFLSSISLAELIRSGTWAEQAYAVQKQRLEHDKSAA
jgi:Rrf2 family transcriptional regulator, iron-sulfur cluster assembly transcription factor